MPTLSSAPRLLAAGLAAALLAGCAPSASRTTAAPVAVLGERPVQHSAVSFYPSQTGLAWAYTPVGETVNVDPYRLQVKGVNIFEDTRVIEYNFSGRGADQTYMRTVSDAEGMRLYGITKPGVVIKFTPAWQELPPSGMLRVGHSWQGSTVMKMVDSRRDRVMSESTFNYRYDVLERRNVTTPDGTHPVYVITRRITGDTTGSFPEAAQMHYTPHVGEVTTYEDLLLSGRNFGRPQQSAGNNRR